MARRYDPLAGVGIRSAAIQQGFNTASSAIANLPAALQKDQQYQRASASYSDAASQNKDLYDTALAVLGDTGIKVREAREGEDPKEYELQIAPILGNAIDQGLITPDEVNTKLAQLSQMPSIKEAGQRSTFAEQNPLREAQPQALDVNDFGSADPTPEPLSMIDELANLTIQGVKNGMASPDNAMSTLSNLRIKENDLEIAREKTKQEQIKERIAGNTKLAGDFNRVDESGKPDNSPFGYDELAGDMQFGDTRTPKPTSHFAHNSGGGSGGSGGSGTPPNVEVKDWLSFQSKADLDEDNLRQLLSNPDTATILDPKTNEQIANPAVERAERKVAENTLTRAFVGSTNMGLIEAADRARLIASDNAQFYGPRAGVLNTDDAGVVSLNLDATYQNVPIIELLGKYEDPKTERPFTVQAIIDKIRSDFSKAGTSK